MHEQRREALRVFFVFLLDHHGDADRSRSPAGLDDDSDFFESRSFPCSIDPDQTGAAVDDSLSTRSDREERMMTKRKAKRVLLARRRRGSIFAAKQKTKGDEGF